MKLLSTWGTRSQAIEEVIVQGHAFYRLYTFSAGQTFDAETSSVDFVPTAEAIIQSLCFIKYGDEFQSFQAAMESTCEIETPYFGLHSGLISTVEFCKQQTKCAIYL